MRRIDLYATTRRAVLIVEKIRAMCPDDRIVVFTAAAPSSASPPLEPDYHMRLVSMCNQTSAELMTYDDKIGSGTPDLILCTNWRRKLSKWRYRDARFGAYCIHDSLLPRWRGHSPLVHAIMAGDTETGATLFELAEEIDAGPIVAQRMIPIRPNDCITSILPTMDAAYLHLVSKLLQNFNAGIKPPTVEQDHSQATIAEKIDYTNLVIDPSWPIERIVNYVRALTYPYPGARWPR